MAEIRHLVPRGARSREEMIAVLHVALEELDSRGDLGGVRIDEWWDETGPEVWMRTTDGPRIRWSVTVDDDGIAFVVRGPFEIRFRRPVAVRRLMERVEAPRG